MDIVDRVSRRQIAMPSRFKDLAGIVRDQATVQPDGIAMVFEGRLTTYGQLDQAACRVANGLRSMNPGSGTRIAQLDKNSDHFNELLVSAAEVGHVLVPVNYRLAPAEIAAVVNDSGAVVLFVGPDYFSIVEQIRPDLHTVRTVIALSGRHSEWEDYRAWRDGQAADDVVIQLSTNGTTGRPKGAQLTHENMVTGGVDPFS